MNAQDLSKGQVVGPYRLVRQLGAGGMGVVWLAATETGQQVAIKFPLDEEYLRALRREASLTGALAHAAIVRLLEVDIEHDPPYIAMEYVPGITLRDALIEGGKLGEQDALRIIREVAEAVHFAHTKGVVHRDLKPENILIGEDGRARVLDFGLGRVVEGLARSIALTGSLRSASGGSIVGTYAYMSPEQREGRAAGPEADVHALGLILHESITGARPTGSLRRALERNGASARTIDVVCRCLEDPSTRFRDAGEMVAALDRVPSEGKAMQTAPIMPDVEPRAGATADQTMPLDDLSALGQLPPPDEASRPASRKAALPWVLVAFILILGTLVFVALR